MTFNEWVRKWRIGPGMNDPRVSRQFVEGTPAASRFFPKESLQEITDLNAESLYSGFDGTVGPGWVPILDRLAEDLVALGWDRDLHQVKEKFGTLRFYIGTGTPEMDARISAAEDETERTCEECGGPGTLRTTGWWKVECADCARKRERSRWP